MNSLIYTSISQFALVNQKIRINTVVVLQPVSLRLWVVFQLSRSEGAGPGWHNKSFIMRALKEEDQKPNPVVQRVKVIMSAGLVVVHAHR